MHPHPSRQPLGGRQCDATHMVFVALGQNLDSHLAGVTRAQQGMDGRQHRIETHVHNTAAHSNHYTDVRGSVLGHYLSLRHLASSCSVVVASLCATLLSQ